MQQELNGAQLGPTATKEISLLDSFYTAAKQSLILFMEPTHIVLIGTQDIVLNALLQGDAFTFVPTQYLNGALVICMQYLTFYISNCGMFTDGPSNSQ